MLLALLRFRHTQNQDIYRVKSEARFIELILVVVAIASHWYYDSLLLEIWLPWSIGGFVGGILGGFILHRMGKLSGNQQKWVLRGAFAFAITGAFFRIY